MLRQFFFIRLLHVSDFPPLWGDALTPFHFSAPDIEYVIEKNVQEPYFAHPFRNQVAVTLGGEHGGSN